MKPMLATLIEKPFDSKEWIFETKWDGYRILAHKSKKVELFSRNEKKFTASFPTIVAEVKKISLPCVLDGEIVILDKGGLSHFQLLQGYKSKKIGTPYYYVFDLLSCNHKDLTHLPLIERKKILKALLQGRNFKYVRFSKHIHEKGATLFKKAKAKGWEGIMAKRKGSTYQKRRSSDWLKIKTTKRQEVVIGGFTAPRGSRKKFGALLVGVYRRGKFVYVGHIGTGFDATLLADIHTQMQRKVTQKCPFQEQPHPNAPVTWVKPKLVCEVSFTEWTRAGIMRHPAFKGMRSDKSPRQIVRE